MPKADQLISKITLANLIESFISDLKDKKYNSSELYNVFAAFFTSIHRDHRNYGKDMEDKDVIDQVVIRVMRQTGDLLRSKGISEKDLVATTKRLYSKWKKSASVKKIGLGI